ncbi:MAG: hypothetical protein QFF03_00790 [Pseudomonadota bacterium]|nr:hypothetical protein [Pseudomonadota bacterium]
MTILDRVRMSICRRREQVILRSDLQKFGGDSQLSAALRKLVDDGVLTRMSPGVFAKARKGSEGKLELLDTPEVVLQDFFRKIGLDAKLVKTERRNDHCIYFVDAGRSRIPKYLRLGNDDVFFVGHSGVHSRFPSQIPTNLEDLPKKEVSKFVCKFAKMHKIIFQRSKLDAWAEAVTRAAGDYASLDSTGQLLTVLYKAKLINASQMSRLMTNHMREQKEKSGRHSIANRSH